jgi:2-C-methyl-D-erythritol 4-phosphate cytidylyltransferase
LKCDIVLVAGGNSSRYKAPLPKQFESINGQALYLWSLNTFLNWVDSGVVSLVVPQEWVEPVSKSFENLPIKERVVVVAGGVSRQESANKGLQALQERSLSPWVMIHDAARPALTTNLIERIWSTGLKYTEDSQVAGVIPGIEARETIKEIEVGSHCSFVSETLNRARLRVIQTPQLLKKKCLTAAYVAAFGNAAVDDSSLVEKLGFKVIVVEGDYDNVKVTFPEDRKRVTDWLRDRYSSP